MAEEEEELTEKQIRSIVRDVHDGRQEENAGGNRKKQGFKPCFPFQAGEGSNIGKAGLTEILDDGNQVIVAAVDLQDQVPRPAVVKKPAQGS